MVVEFVVESDVQRLGEGDALTVARTHGVPTALCAIVDDDEPAVRRELALIPRFVDQQRPRARMERDCVLVFERRAVPRNQFAIGDIVCAERVVAVLGRAEEAHLSRGELDHLEVVDVQHRRIRPLPLVVRVFALIGLEIAVAPAPDRNLDGLGRSGWNGRGRRRGREEETIAVFAVVDVAIDARRPTAAGTVAPRVWHDMRRKRHRPVRRDHVRTAHGSKISGFVDAEWGACTCERPKSLTKANLLPSARNEIQQNGPAPSQSLRSSRTSIALADLNAVAVLSCAATAMRPSNRPWRPR